MSVITLTRENFDHVVASHDLLVIEFDASGSVLDRLAEHSSAATFAQIDPVDEPAIAAMFGQSTGPALLIFREQVVLYLESGEHSVQRIEQLVQQVQGLDMAAIQAEIEEQKRAEVALRMRRVCPTARRRNP